MNQYGFLVCVLHGYCMWPNSLTFCLIITFSVATYGQQTMVFSTVKDTLVADINEIIIRDAYQKLGIQVFIKKLPAARALQKSNSGEFDGELFRIPGIQKKYPNLFMIPVVSYEVDIRAYSKRSDFKVVGWNSLKLFKIGIERGVQFSEVATDGMNRQIVNSNQQLFRILDKDRVDFVVTDIWSALGSLTELERTGFPINEIFVLSPRVMAIELHHYLHMKHEALIPKVNQAIQESLRSGIAKQAEDKIRKQYVLKEDKYEQF